MRRVTMAATSIAAAGLVAAAPAGAGIAGPTESLGSAGGFEYLKAKFESVVSQTGAPANCDGGDGVRGGGGTISGSGENAALNASYPTSFEGDGWLAEGSTSAPGGRTVTTYAICKEEALGFSNGNGSLAAAGEPFDMTSDTQGCGPGEQAIYGVNGSGGDVRVTQLQPAADGLSWTTAIQNHADEGANYSVWWACDDALNPTLRQSEVIAVKPGDIGKATARCKGGEAAISGGFLSGLNGEPRRDTWATSTRPYDSKDKKKTPDDGWSVKVQNGRDIGKTKIAAYAVCQEK